MNMEEIGRRRDELQNASAAYAEAENRVKAAREAYIEILEGSVPVGKRASSVGSSKLEEPDAKRARTSLNARGREKASMEEASNGVWQGVSA